MWTGTLSPPLGHRAEIATGIAANFEVELCADAGTMCGVRTEP